MCGHAANRSAEKLDEARAQSLRQAIERDYPLLLRRLAVIVYRVCGRLRRDEVAERVEEVLGEAVKRALQTAAAFDPQRSATAWLMGFALHILQEQRRPRRAVVQSDLGDEAWRAVLEDLHSADDADATTIRLDIRQALARLEEAPRRALELRYFKGLDGEELAKALDAPTSGAARVRVARALRVLRKTFAACKDEESHD
ncbi:MAG TPA: sigma-70 family RNA polymerase sigma factor [Gemmataceae bacterium]|nr:sigma-70 family RNA polymerase sigma factor [Gemmataceae bacterium]